MARLIRELAALVPATTTHGDAFANLTRLLARLQQSVLLADADRERRLRTSEFERRKVETNIGFARSLLARVEQKAAGPTMLVPTDLHRKRQVLEQLAERLHDLEELGRAEVDADSSDGEDILSDVLVTPSESMNSSGWPLIARENPDGLNVCRSDPMMDNPDHAQDGTGENPASEPQLVMHGPGPEASPTLRLRRKESKKETETTQSTGVALCENRSASLSQMATTEAILDHQRAEHDALAETILHMARQLKESTHAFSHSLEEDMNIIGRAGAGMETSEKGMEAASRRIGTLRMMTEGKGWWARMMLYPSIYGLMVLLVVIVFALPKIRFSTW